MFNKRNRICRIVSPPVYLAGNADPGYPVNALSV
jgi:hypothetical protein